MTLTPAKIKKQREFLDGCEWTLTTLALLLGKGWVISAALQAIHTEIETERLARPELRRTDKGGGHG